MRPPQRRALSVIILAGGQGARMGYRDKARLRLRSATLLQRLHASLSPLAAELIIVRRRPRDATSLPAGSARAWDRCSGQGPVAGLEAGMRRATRAWCLCVPVDSLAPPPDSLMRLSRATQQGGYWRYRDDNYFLHLLLPRRQGRALGRFLDKGGRSAANACAQLGLPAVQAPDRLATVWSINTRAQWRRTQRQRPCGKR